PLNGDGLYGGGVLGSEDGFKALLRPRLEIGGPRHIARAAGKAGLLGLVGGLGALQLVVTGSGTLRSGGGLVLCRRALCRATAQALRGCRRLVDRLRVLRLLARGLASRAGRLGELIKPLLCCPRAFVIKRGNDC